MKKSIFVTILMLVTPSFGYSKNVSAAAVPAICDKVKSYDKGNFIYSIGDVLLAKPEFEYYWGISDEDRKYLDELSKIIKAFNINIIALPIPYKASIYINDSNNPSPKKYDPVKARSFYDSQIKNLNDHGFTAINLDNIARKMPSGKSFFANHDHHWTGDAMEIVAEKVKQVVDKLGLKIDRNSQTTLTRTAANYDGSVAGELFNECGYKFPVAEKRTFYDLSIKGSESLLGSTNEDVVAVGDSFSISYFGFDKVLSDKLKTPIINNSINGGGFSASINGYFASLKPSDHKAKLVIWTALPIVTSTNGLRELNPSIYQAYQASTPVKRFALNQIKSGVANFNSVLDRNTRYYLRVKVDGPKAQELHIKFDYGGKKEDISLYRSEQAQKDSYSTEYYYELKPNTTNLKSIDVSVPDKADINVEVYKYGKL